MNLKNFPVRLIKFISGIKMQRRCGDKRKKYMHPSPFSWRGAGVRLI